MLTLLTEIGICYKRYLKNYEIFTVFIACDIGCDPACLLPKHGWPAISQAELALPGQFGIGHRVFASRRRLADVPS